MKADSGRGSTSRDTTRVLLVDGSRIGAQLLSAALEDEHDLECVGVAEDFTAAVLEALRLQPDVVLVVGLHLELDHWSAARVALAQACPTSRVVMLVPTGSERAFDPAEHERVCVVSAQEADLASLLAALRDASRGVGAAPQVSRAGGTDSSEVRGADLVPADLALLRLVAAGFDSESSARELQISPGLVRQRLRRICTDLGVDTPTQAVAVAVASRRLTLHPPA